MRERRDAADGKAGDAFHNIGVGTYDLAGKTKLGTQGFGIAPPIARDQCHHVGAANCKHQ